MMAMLLNVVFAGAFLAAMFLIGTLMLRITGWDHSVISAVAWGFITVTGVFQLVAYPLYLAKASFGTLFTLFSAVLAVLLAAGVFAAVRGKVWRSAVAQGEQLWADFRQTPIPFLLLGFMILLFLYYGVFYDHPTHDDSFYLPRAMEVLSRNTLDISHAVGWFGYEIEGFPKTNDASTMEFFKAYLSRLSGIHVTVLCRNGFQIALLLINLASIWTFTDAFARKKENASSVRLYALILWIALLMLDLTREACGQWIVNKLWQGKSMLPGMVFPMLFAACGVIMQHIESFKIREWLSIFLLLLSGLCVSIVGVMLTPILYVLLGVSFLLVTKFRHFGRIAPCAVVAAIPAILTVAVNYFSAVADNVEAAASAEPLRTWVEELTYSTNKLAFALFLVCAVWVFFKGDVLERALFVVMPLLHFLTFLNPLLRRFVATYVTTYAVYFRLFWILPVLLLPAYWIPHVLVRALEPKRLQTALVFACFSMSLYIGAQWSRDRMYGVQALIPLTRISPARENIYRIDPDTFAICQTIESDWTREDRPLVLLYDNDYRQDEIRQYSEKINLACGMRQETVSLLTDCIPGTETRKCDFYEIYQTIEDGAYLHDMLTRLGIDYVCFIDEPACQEPEASGFTVLYANERALWRVDPLPAAQ